MFLMTLWSTDQSFAEWKSIQDIGQETSLWAVEGEGFESLRPSMGWVSGNCLGRREIQ